MLTRGVAGNARSLPAFVIVPVTGSSSMTDHRRISLDVQTGMGRTLARVWLSPPPANVAVGIAESCPGRRLFTARAAAEIRREPCTFGIERYAKVVVREVLSLWN